MKNPKQKSHSEERLFRCRDAMIAPLIHMILEIVVQSELWSHSGAIQIETIVFMIHAVVVLRESETEGGSPVLSGHPSHTRSQADGIAIVVDNTKVTSEVHEHAEFLNCHEVAA